MTTLRLHVGQGGAQTTLAFSRFPVNIGRDTTNECRLEFAFVSRMHAQLYLRGGRLWLRDRESRQGTWVRGSDRVAPTEPVDLEGVGNEFRIGPLRVRAELIEDVTTKRLEPPADRAELRVETVEVSGKAFPLAPQASPAPAVIAPPELLTRGGLTLEQALDRFKSACAELAAAAKRAATTDPSSLASVATQVDAASSPLRNVVSSGPSRARGTQRVALEHLQQLAVRCAPKSGAPRSPEAAVAFLRRLEVVLEVLLDGFVALRFAYGCEVGEDAQAQALSRGELAAQLLDWSADDSALDGLHRDLSHLVTQHARLAAEATSGLDGVFAALDPESIDAACDVASPWHPIRSRVRWAEFVRRFETLDRERRRHRTLGPTFASIARALGGRAGSPLPPPPAKTMTLRLAAT